MPLKEAREEKEKDSEVSAGAVINLGTGKKTARTGQERGKAREPIQTKVSARGESKKDSSIKEAGKVKEKDRALNVAKWATSPETAGRKVPKMWDK